MALVVGAAIPVAAAGQDVEGGGVAAGERARLLAELRSAAAPPSELATTATIDVPGGGVIHRYRQRVGGHPVLGGDVVVADPVDAAPTLVVDHSVTRVDADADARLGRRDAIARARELTDAAKLRARPRARLGFDPRTGALAWEVALPAVDPLADHLLLIDAVDGRPLRAVELLRRATGTASIFDPNPVVSQGSYTGLRDRGDRGSTRLSSLHVPVVLSRLAGTNGCLRGTYVEARLGRKARRVCTPGFDFSGVKRATNRFEAVMAYFHIDRTRAYIDGLVLSEGLRSSPQRVRANGISVDNSYYSPLTRGITFGTGGVDDGEDADVIVHEYGHAVQDQQVRGFGESLEGRAMGEGFGDFLAAVMSSQVTGGDPRFDPCMFEWDGLSYVGRRCARRTDKPLTAEQARARCAGSEHCLGEAWSGALWKLRGELATDPAGLAVMDRVVIESHFMLTRRAGFRDGARALLAADQLLYAGAHRAAIAAEMIRRQFCPKRGC